MRIIAGEFRSRKLLSPRGFGTRPMPDRVKESVFSMLGTRVEGARVVDAFAGSGAVGLEAISRGAQSCLFIERDRAVCEIIQGNIDLLGVGDRCQVVRGDALGLSVIARCPRPTDLIFVDPPYPLVWEEAGWAGVVGQCEQFAPVLAADGFLVLRTPWPFFFGEQQREDEQEDEDDGDEGHRPGREGRRGRERRGGKPSAHKGSPQRHERQRGRRIRNWEDLAHPHASASHRDDASEPDLSSEDWQELSPEEIEQAMADDEGGPHGADGDMAEGDADHGDEGAPAEVETPPAGSSGVARVHASLAIPGLRGPETHVYRKTAVHWYMRRT